MVRPILIFHSDATKAGRCPGSDDEVGTYNLTVFRIFYLTVGKVGKLTPLKKGFILQSKGAHFEKIRRRATRDEIILHFTAALRAVQHSLYTSNLLPTPICYGSENMIFILSKPLQDLDQPHFGPSPCVTGMTSALIVQLCQCLENHFTV